jgi:hypothetical protein
MLDRVLNLFDLHATAGSSARGGSLSKDTLACLLGHLRLGVSVAEAEELATFCAGGGPANPNWADPGTEPGGMVQLNGLCTLLARSQEDPEMLGVVNQLREDAKRRLAGRGPAFAAAAASFLASASSSNPGGDGTEMLPEAEFRRCVACALPGADAGTEDDEDRLVLLSDKNAAGEIYWRLFLQTYAGWQDWGSDEDVVLFKGKPPLSPKKPPNRSDPASTQQSWRAMKTAMAEAAATGASDPNAVGAGRTTPASEREPGRCRCVIS